MPAMPCSLSSVLAVQRTCQDCNRKPETFSKDAKVCSWSFTMNFAMLTLAKSSETNKHPNTQINQHYWILIWPASFEVLLIYVFSKLLLAPHCSWSYGPRNWQLHSMHANRFSSYWLRCQTTLPFLGSQNEKYLGKYRIGALLAYDICYDRSQ